VDVSSLDVLGHGSQWWGRAFEGVPVRILRRMPSRVLIGRKFLLEQTIVLDLHKGSRSFQINGVTYQGRIVNDPGFMQGTEEVAVITEDVTSSKKEMDIYGFGSGEEDHDALRCLILEYSDVFSPRTETAPGV
jgi:hypothetical protein